MFRMVVVLVEYDIQQVTYACPKSSFQVFYGGLDFCLWDFEGVIVVS